MLLQNSRPASVAKGPPPDVGGVLGSERYLEVIADREDPEYSETTQWCGDYFDSGRFDLSFAQQDIRNALQLERKRRLYQPKPSHQLETNLNKP